MKKQVIFSEQANAPVGPYSQGILANGFLFISGQTAGEKVGIGSVEDETQAVFNSLKLILQAAGMDFENVVKSSVFLQDMNDFSKMNAVYATFFQSDFPARETIQVARLPQDARVEISCIAFK
jgi:2-iminobutanoate/2-iminopropanoate deaminase